LPVALALLRATVSVKYISGQTGLGSELEKESQESHSNGSSNKRAITVSNVKRPKLESGWIDEATDLLATMEGDAAVEECAAIARRYREGA
jgi:hypothetical protein